MITPYYQDDAVTLYCADALQVMPHFGFRFAACITDPPYEQTALAWDRWPLGWPAAVANLTNQLWCFGSFRMFLARASEFERWNLAQDLVWEKQNGSGFNTDRFNRVHESIVHWYRGDWGNLHVEQQMQAGLERPSARVSARGKTAHKGAIASAAYEYTGERVMRSVLHCPNMHGRAVNETQKPEELLQPLIEYSVPKGGIVLDPFAGAGTTGVRAKAVGRRAVLIEIRESQCQQIVERLRQQVLPL